MGRVVLESTSPGPQPGAKPSQLPTPMKRHPVKLHEKSPMSVTPGFEMGLGGFVSHRSVPGHKRRGYTDSEFADCSANCHVPIPDGLQLGRRKVMEGNLVVFELSGVCGTVSGRQSGPAAWLDVSAHSPVRRIPTIFQNCAR